MLRIQSARESDVAVILRLIEALAEYEQLTDEVVATEEQLRATLFGETRGAEVLLAYSADGAVGFAVFFPTYSTFLGRPGVYLEDLFVLPQWRARGIGRSLFQRVAEIAVERDCGRMEWSVLDWNQPAIEFYQRRGAQAMEQWTTYRLSGDALREVGRRSRSEEGSRS